MTVSFFYLINNAACASFLDNARSITLRPYVGLGFQTSFTDPQNHRGISYNKLIDYNKNAFGLHLGVAAGEYLMFEFSGYGSIPTSMGNSHTSESYGISKNSADLTVLRFTSILALSHEKTGKENKLLIMLGAVHAFSNNEYKIANKAAVPSSIQYDTFGTHVEVGLGYMRQISKYFALRGEVRYSPLQLSKTTDHLVSGMVGIFLTL